MTFRPTRTSVALLVLLGAMAACSSEESRAKKAYLVACNMALRNEEICSCTYDRLRVKHTAEELRHASTSGEMPSPELARDMAEASLACIRHAQASP
jgi:hypothetical protein